jgi:hypothetical protein
VKRQEQGALDAPQYYPKAQIRQGADRSAKAEGQSSPPAHRGARVIRTDALRFMLILEEPRGGQERKQDSEDDPDINAHQSSPAAALPTNSSLTDGIYFDDLVAQAPERKPVPSSPRNCRDVAHAHANRIGTNQTVLVLISTRGATRSPQRSFPGVGYLVQHVLHARGLR